jgi:hypothetical protein
MLFIFASQVKFVLTFSVPGLSDELYLGLFRLFHLLIEQLLHLLNLLFSFLDHAFKLDDDFLVLLNREVMSSKLSFKSIVLLLWHTNLLYHGLSRRPVRGGAHRLHMTCLPCHVEKAKFVTFTFAAVLQCIGFESLRVF